MKQLFTKVKKSSEIKILFLLKEKYFGKAKVGHDKNVIEPEKQHLANLDHTSKYSKHCLYSLQRTLKPIKSKISKLP